MFKKILEGTYTSCRDYGNFTCIDIGAEELEVVLDAMNLEKKRVRITIETIDSEMVEVDLSRIVNSPEALEYLGLNPHNVYETEEEQNKTYEIEAALAKKWGLI